MDKSKLSERDICTKYITPAIDKAGWDVMAQVREEVSFTKGRVIVKGKTVHRGDSKRADYLLYYKPELCIAVVEAKDNNKPLGTGMPQARRYAEMLDVPYAFSSNGDAFIFHDRTGNAEGTETEITLAEFPSPETLWAGYCKWKGIKNEAQAIVTQDYYTDGSGKTPRYYQQVAINRTVEAVAKGQDRALLVMATGTGKTYTAFQIIWRLWKSGAKKRILFLADRNILVDQTRVNDFKPFGNAMTKITNRTVDKSYEIFLSLYQAVTGTDESKNIYKQFSPDFFDLIVVDECHRGSAKEESAWRDILEYFSGATQIGMTATPKETKKVSNIDYFGEAVYTYSLKQGIDDGFLAPYKVVRIDFDKDYGWRPSKGQLDKYGNEIEDRIYNQKDMDRNLVLEKRTELVAQKVTELLKSQGRYNKTIVFCEDIDHAERMRRALVNLNDDITHKNNKYVMRITGDNPEGKAALDDFINPEETYPVIATTSKLMTTGVDAQTCKLVVLDQRIQSMTEFKQIIGRGTRINEEYDKLFFTIMDFKRATELFADPDFDGDPVQIFEPEQGQSPDPDAEEEGEVVPDNDPDEIIFPGDDRPTKRIKYYVKGVPVSVAAERIQYYGTDGKLITESLKDYTKKMVKKEFQTMEAFLTRWTEAEQKQAIVQELEERGVIFEALEKEVGKDYGPFDLICHVVFDKPLLSRKQRADNVRKRDYFTQYGEKTREVLTALLEKFASEGVEDLETMDILRVPPITHIGTPMEIVTAFGGKKKYLSAVRELKQELYRVAA
ncbi:MAG: DEAD/DEAH box helicase family protein [Myxococcales bacterium]|nr:DEAD/DEAH box helicase family protein [Myxococcales bacterium]